MSESSPSPSTLATARQRLQAAIEAEQRAGRHVRDLRLAREPLNHSLDYPTHQARKRAQDELDEKIANAADKANFLTDMRVAAAEAVAAEELRTAETTDAEATDQLAAGSEELRLAVQAAAEQLAQPMARIAEAARRKAGVAAALREAGKTPKPIDVASFANVATSLLDRETGPAGAFKTALRVIEWLAGEDGRKNARAEAARQSEREAFEADLRGANGPEAMARAQERRRQEMASFYSSSTASTLAAQYAELFGRARAGLLREEA